MPLQEQGCASAVPCSEQGAWLQLLPWDGEAKGRSSQWGTWVTALIPVEGGTGMWGWPWDLLCPVATP